MRVTATEARNRFGSFCARACRAALLVLLAVNPQALAQDMIRICQATPTFTS